MKRAIEKAIENGFELLQFFKHKELVEILEWHIIGGDEEELMIRYKLWGASSIKAINFYRLIFGTDFIDKLVGNRCLKGYEKTEGTPICSYSKFFESMECKDCIYIGEGRDHRSKLANMPLKDMVEYINKLTEG